MSAPMDPVKGVWRQWADRFAAMSKRERGLTAVTLVVGGGFIIFTLAVEPHLLQTQRANKAEAAARGELAKQQAQLASLKAQAVDPDALNRQRLEQARNQRTVLGERLASFEAGMVSPARMQAFLEGLLTRNRSIELLELKTLAVEQVAAGNPENIAVSGLAQAAQIVGDPASLLASGKLAVVNAGAEGIYQHGVEIRLAGGYNDLLNYLAELERMPQRVMWNSVRLEVIKYPRNELTLRVYTLSLDKNWLVL